MDSQITFQTNPIKAADLIEKASRDSDGAQVTFIGRARNRSRGKDVSHLEYELYESMAQKEMEKILITAKEKWDITTSTVIHRYGIVKIGEASILIIVTSPHRKDSYEASQYIIDTIKKTVPIWKKEFYTDGSQWITNRS